MSIELLAPAGNLEKAKTAILYGANAVYIGGQAFSLRSRASNFNVAQIQELCEFAHNHGSKVHVTVNIIPHPSDLEGLESYLDDLNQAGIDAIISASPTIIQTALAMPDRHFEVHVSTQRSILNGQAVRFWKKLGVDRVVLGRETPVRAIEQICKEENIPIEVFIHGGMCISFSGRCVLSNHMTNRDANRGGCAQSCRWKYTLREDETPIGSIPFSMSSKDLQAAKQIEAFIQAGVSSLKIEGRMKSDYYLAVVVGAYRRLIDFIETHGYASEEILTQTIQELSRAENRPTGPGFYEGLPDENVQLYRKHDENVSQEYIGLVLEADRPGYLKVQVKNHFEDNLDVELIGPGLAPMAWQLHGIENADHLPITVCPHPMEIVYLQSEIQVPAGSMLRKQRKESFSKTI